jgi:hypothetical protein
MQEKVEYQQEGQGLSTLVKSGQTGESDNDEKDNCLWSGRAKTIHKFSKAGHVLNINQSPQWGVV